MIMDCGKPMIIGSVPVPCHDTPGTALLPGALSRSDQDPRQSQAKDIEEEAREVHGISKRTLERARRALRIPTAKRDDGWWISLPEHEGDLTEPPERQTPLPAKTANTANTVFKGDVGGVGGVDLHCESCGAPISPLRLAQAGQLCVRCEASP